MRIDIRETAELQRESNAFVKSWLWRYRDAKLDLRRLDGEYRELVSAQEAAGAISYDGMPTSSNTISDLSDLMVARDRLLSKIIKAKNRMTKAYVEITRAIDQLDYPIEKDIMSYRYIQLPDGYGLMEWQEIADNIRYSSAHVQKVHGIALSKLADIIRNLDSQ